VLNGHIDTHKICIFTQIHFISFQVRPNVNHKMNTNTKNCYRQTKSPVRGNTNSNSNKDNNLSVLLLS